MDFYFLQSVQLNFTIGQSFFAELIQDIESILFEKGYKVILCNAQRNKEKERAYLRCS